MDFGVNTLTRGPAAGREGYLAVARKAEALGFGYLGVNDHVVVPGDIHSRYPYTEEGNWPGKTAGECLDQLGTLCFLAGCTEKLRLLTSVMVLAHRHPVLTAKLLATADVLSNGRVIVGCGVGWMKEEIEALGGPPFAARGKAADEYLDAFKVLWTHDEPSYRGEHVKFDGFVFAPKPVQKPHPPLWIGGEGPVALRRVVRVGDGWYPVSNNPQHRLDTPERLQAGVTELRRTAEAARRDPASIDIAFVHLGPVSNKARMEDGKRQAFTGPAADIAADVDARARCGIRHLSLTFQGGSLQETLDRMQWFAENVMPLTRRES